MKLPKHLLESDIKWRKPSDVLINTGDVLLAYQHRTIKGRNGLTYIQHDVPEAEVGNTASKLNVVADPDYRLVAWAWVCWDSDWK
jgi:hypothetical protein